MEMLVVPNVDVIRREIVTGSTAKLGSKLGGVLTRRNLNWSLMLPTYTTGVVGILQMVFTNLILVVHGNKIVDQPLMSSMAIRAYRNADVVHSRGGY